MNLKISCKAYNIERGQVTAIKYQSQVYFLKQEKSKETKTETKTEKSTLTKVCAKCGKEKSIDEFYKNKGGTFGRHAYCIDCLKNYSQMAREKTIKNWNKFRIKG